MDPGYCYTHMDADIQPVRSIGRRTRSKHGRRRGWQTEMTAETGKVYMETETADSQGEEHDTLTLNVDFTQTES